MKPTEELKNEHRVIELVLSALEGMAARGMKEGTIDGKDAREAVGFLRNFADKCHHAKEEKRLFALMGEKGFPAEGGPIAVMLADHDTGRAHVRVMADAISGAESGDRKALGAFSANALGFAELLRNHIMKEDSILYPMADAAFDDADQARLAREFEEAEREMGEGVHERFHAVAESLHGKYIPKHTGVAWNSAHEGCMTCGREM